MKRVWQAAAVFHAAISMAGAEENGKPFTWSAPKVAQSIFTQDLGMLDSERDDYATSLAGIAANTVVKSKASPSSLADARRMLALALQLSSRNKRAVVVNFQLTKGVLPDLAEGTYSPQAFARLILTRGQLLAKQAGEQDRKLARYFIQLAAELDPKNEDSVYASEMQRLDHGAVDWSAVTDGVEKKE